MAATWKGSISFGLVDIPVELYRAEERDETKSTMLDKRDLAPVGYRRYNKKTGEEVAWSDIVSGFEYDEGQYVVLTDEEREAAHPKSTHTIEILEFVDAKDVDPIYFETPYYIHPRTGAEKRYVLLRETLKRTGKAGIAQVILRSKQHLASITVRGPALILNLLRYDHEIRDPSSLKLPDVKSAEARVSQGEMKMAEQLVSSMASKWAPSKYRDSYRDELKKLVETKARKGRVYAVEKADRGAADDDARVLDLMAALKRSVRERSSATARRRPPARKRRASRAS